MLIQETEIQISSRLIFHENCVSGTKHINYFLTFTLFLHATYVWFQMNQTHHFITN